MAGTRLSHVTSSRSTTVQNERREKRRSTTSELPATRAASTPTTRPLMWNSGRGEKPRSVASSPRWAATPRAVWSSCASLRGINLGAPVVPELAMIRAARGPSTAPTSGRRQVAPSPDSVTAPPAATAAATAGSPVSVTTAARPAAPTWAASSAGDPHGSRGATVVPVASAARKWAAAARGSARCRPIRAPGSRSRARQASAARATPSQVRRRPVAPSVKAVALRSRRRCSRSWSVESVTVSLPSGICGAVSCGLGAR